MATKTKNELKEKIDSEDGVAKHKVNPSKVEKGHLMAFLYYAKVDSVRMNGANLEVLGLDNNQGSFGVHGLELVQNSFSADQYEVEKKVNQTDMIDVLSVSYNRPFTVCYKTEKDEERILRGRLVQPDMRRGRSMCEDLDKPDGDRIRLVDHRTLKWLIVDGVKYILKK